MSYFEGHVDSNLFVLSICLVWRARGGVEDNYYGEFGDSYSTPHSLGYYAGDSPQRDYNYALFIVKRYTVAFRGILTLVCLCSQRNLPNQIASIRCIWKLFWVARRMQLAQLEVTCIIGGTYYIWVLGGT